jgi:hypothetical protein
MHISQHAQFVVPFAFKSVGDQAVVRIDRNRCESTGGSFRPVSYCQPARWLLWRGAL